MDPKEKRAMEIMQEGDQLAKSGKGFLNQWFGGSSKLEQACQKYVDAGNLFKVSIFNAFK